MGEPTRSYPIALDCAAAVNLAALVLFLGTEVALLFFITPSTAVLAFAGPICHYGIILSLLTAAILVVFRNRFATARRHRGK